MNAFQLPKMTIESVYQFNRDEVINELKASKTLIAFYQAANGDGRFLFTGLSENEYAILVYLIHRHIEVFNFFKSVIITIEKFRENDEDAAEFLYKTSKYLNLKNQ